MQGRLHGHGHESKDKKNHVPLKHIIMFTQALFKSSYFDVTLGGDQRKQSYRINAAPQV